MASNSYKMPTWEEISDDPSVVAVYRWVIIDSREIRNINPANGVNEGDDPQYGVWISKDTSRMEYTYIARLYSKHRGWGATFGCAYSDDGDTLKTVKILDRNDSMKKQITWEPKAEVGRNSESGPSQKAKKLLFKMIFDIPSPDQGGIRDNNGNNLLRYSIIQNPDGFEGIEQKEELLWWAKKEVPGKQYTVLTDAEVARLIFDGKIGHESKSISPEFMRLLMSQ